MTGRLFLSNRTNNPTRPKHTMPLGNGSANYNSGPLVLLTPRTKTPDGKPTKPHFTADRFNEANQPVRDEQTYTEIGGDLFRAETKNRTITVNNKPKQVTDWVLYLRDSEAAYRLPLNQNGAGRDLLNRFAKLIESGDFTGLTISYYQNKRGRDAYSLQQRGERVEWMYSLDQLPQPIEIVHPKTGEVEKRDYEPLDTFFNEVVTQIAAALGQKERAPATETSSEQEAADAEEQVAQEEAPAPTPAPKPAARLAPKVVASPAKPTTTPAPKAPATTTRPAPKATAQAGARPAARPAPKAAAAPATEPAAQENLDEDIPF